MCVVSLQDVINVLGGMGVLLPLLEQVCEAEQVNSGSQEISDHLLGPELTSPRGPTAMLLPLNKSPGQVMFSSDITHSISFFLHCILDAVIMPSPKFIGTGTLSLKGDVAVFRYLKT